MLKRIFGLLLSVVLAATFMVPVAFAEDGIPAIDGHYTYFNHAGDSYPDLEVRTDLLPDGSFSNTSIEIVEYCNIETFANQITFVIKTDVTTHTILAQYDTPLQSQNRIKILSINGIFSSETVNMYIDDYYTENGIHLVGTLKAVSEDGTLGIHLFAPNEVFVIGKSTPTAPAIPNGRYGGTGTAAVDVVFGKWNIATLPLINATVTDTNLTLSFRANKIDYLVSAPRVSVASDGTATYHAVEGERTWDITIDPSGALAGSVEYSGDKGTMDFNMTLVAK